MNGECLHRGRRARAAVTPTANERAEIDAEDQTAELKSEKAESKNSEVRIIFQAPSLIAVASEHLDRDRISDSTVSKIKLTFFPKTGKLKGSF